MIFLPSVHFYDGKDTVYGYSGPNLTLVVDGGLFLHAHTHTHTHTRDNVVCGDNNNNNNNNERASGIVVVGLFLWVLWSIVVWWNTLRNRSNEVERTIEAGKYRPSKDKDVSSFVVVSCPFYGGTCFVQRTVERCETKEWSIASRKNTRSHAGRQADTHALEGFIH